FLIGAVEEVAKEEGKEDGDDEFVDEVVNDGLRGGRGTPKMAPETIMGRVIITSS
ncbi:unnamed protein product, partial [Sphagnum balticum]